MNRCRSAEPRAILPSILVLCGPSGCGKSTLISKLMSDFPGRFGFSVSHTTRGPRPGETNGINYHFVDRLRMEADIASGKFLEYANVHGNLYGSSFEAINAVQDTGKVCILDIDVQGVDTVKSSKFLNQNDIVFVMLVPPSIAALEERLRARKTDSDAVIRERLENAKHELEWKLKPEGYWHRILVNDKIERCYDELVGIVKQFFHLQPSHLGTLSVRKVHPHHIIDQS